MLAQEAGDVTTAIERYHQALAIETTDPIATYLLEKALKEQVDEGACQFDGLPIGLVDLDLDPFAFGDQAKEGMFSGTAYPGHQAIGQNRFLQLPPFPNYGKLAEAAKVEAEREQAKRVRDAQDARARSRVVVGADVDRSDQSRSDHSDLDEDVDEKEDYVSDEEGEGGETRVEDDSAEYDEADEDNTAMSVSMNMSVSMEDDGDASGGEVGSDVEDQSASRIGEGSTMDLE